MEYAHLSIDEKLQKIKEVKYHYEIMLGVKLKTLEIESSPLDSKGIIPCVIKFASL